MGGLTITLPGEAVLFSIKTVVTRGGMTQPPSVGIVADLDEVRPYAAKTTRYSALVAVFSSAELRKSRVCISHPMSTSRQRGI